jgi:hypothetical protein
MKAFSFSTEGIVILSRYQAKPSYPLKPWDSQFLVGRMVAQAESLKEVEAQAGSSPVLNFHPESGLRVLHSGCLVQEVRIISHIRKADEKRREDFLIGFRS